MYVRLFMKRYSISRNYLAYLVLESDHRICISTEYVG